MNLPHIDLVLCLHSFWRLWEGEIESVFFFCMKPVIYTIVFTSTH